MRFSRMFEQKAAYKKVQNPSFFFCSFSFSLPFSRLIPFSSITPKPTILSASQFIRLRYNFFFLFFCTASAQLFFLYRIKVKKCIILRNKNILSLKRYLFTFFFLDKNLPFWVCFFYAHFISKCRMVREASFSFLCFFYLHLNVNSFQIV